MNFLQSEILKSIFHNMVLISSVPVLQESADDLADLAVVRAMHCLRLLIRCSQLGPLLSVNYEFYQIC